VKQKHHWNSLGIVTFRFIYIQYNFLSFHRCKKVYDGVTHAAKLYPNAYVIMILIGTLKGKLKFLLPACCTEFYEDILLEASYYISPYS
jgi:hypothetical protein